MRFIKDHGGRITLVYNHLSVLNTCENGLLVLHFQLQVHVGKLVSGDLESVVSEKHS